VTVLPDPGLLPAAAVVEAIDEGYRRKPREEKVRRYIGASVIGKDCDAYLSFSLRGFPEDPPSPKLLRIFRLGHTVEELVVEDLKRAGLNVMDRDPMSGKQFNLQAFGGHVSTNLDGLHELADGSLEVVEIKSMNNRLWKECNTKGVRSSHPQYFDQMQMMMGLGGFKSSLFVAYNKDTSEYLAQRIEFDDLQWSFLQTRIERALSGKVSRLGKDENDWRCSGCFRRSVCWGKTKTEKECVFCAHATPLSSGGWHCSKHDKEARNACSDFEQFEPK
jgi:hypothetical protein